MNKFFKIIFSIELALAGFLGVVAYYENHKDDDCITRSSAMYWNKVTCDDREFYQQKTTAEVAEYKRRVHGKRY